MNAMKQEAPERQEIEALLPWHAAGTLSRRDAQRVEEAVARDPELARRYLGAPSARPKLFASIDAEPALARRRSISAPAFRNSLRA